MNAFDKAYLFNITMPLQPPNMAVNLDLILRTLGTMCPRRAHGEDAAIPTKFDGNRPSNATSSRGSISHRVTR